MGLGGVGRNRWSGEVGGISLKWVGFGRSMCE